MSGKRASKQLSEGAWAGHRCFIVGGGPSLTSFDWSLLAGEPHVIAINRAFLDCPNAAIWFSEDLRVIELYHERPEWKAFKGLKLFHALAPSYADQARALDPSLIIIERKREDKFWAKKFSEGLSYSSNSMIGALNVADLLGAEPILILGLDCNRVGKQTSNYHNDYPADWKTGDTQYDSFVSDFKYWAALHLKGKRVYNLNINSAVDCWPRVYWDVMDGAIRVVHVSPESAR